MRKQQIQTLTLQYLEQNQCGQYFAQTTFDYFYNIVKNRFQSCVDCALAIYDSFIINSKPTTNESDI